MAGETEISYLEAGEGDAVLFVHGWPTNAELWRNILPAVAASGRRAIALDLPAFGQSDKPDVDYSLSFYESVLTQFLDAIQVDQVGLVLHDLGGPIGLYWMSRNRERVTEIALLNTLVYPDVSWAVKLFVLSTRTPGVRSWISSARGIRWAMRFGVVDKACITPEVAALYQDPYKDKADRHALLATGHGSPSGFGRIAPSLAKFERPVRIIYGAQDRILPDVKATMARVAEQLRQAQITALPNAGHFLQEDSPDEVASLLAEFLGGSAASND
jgi:pimeloyl-ACP methyl ester carboxylesterase